jgi:hypothetical protein
MVLVWLWDGFGMVMVLTWYWIKMIFGIAF